MQGGGYLVFPREIRKLQGHSVPYPAQMGPDRIATRPFEPERRGQLFREQIPQSLHRHTNRVGRETNELFGSRFAVDETGIIAANDDRSSGFRKFDQLIERAAADRRQFRKHHPAVGHLPDHEAIRIGTTRLGDNLFVAEIEIPVRTHQPGQYRLLHAGGCNQAGLGLQVGRLLRMDHAYIGLVHSGRREITKPGGKVLE